MVTFASAVTPTTPVLVTSNWGVVPFVSYTFLNLESVYNSNLNAG